MSFLQHLIQICKKNPKARTPNDLDFLLDLTKQSKLFQSAKSSTLHKTCCKYFFYEFCPAGQYLFSYGSAGSKFYVIYSGKVGIQVPNEEGSLEEVLQLTDGDSFGELALKSSNPRQASVLCLTDSHFIYLNKQDYQASLSSFVEEKKSKITEFLTSVAPFRSFSKSALSKLSYLLTETSAKKGQVLYKEGDKPGEVFFIVNGKTGFYKKLKTNNEKNQNTALRVFEVLVGQKGSGELFGEEEIITRTNRLYTCKVITETSEILVAKKDDLLKSIKNKEFWNSVKNNAEKQKNLVEERVKLICELKSASVVSVAGRQIGASLKAEKILSARRTLSAVFGQSTEPDLLIGEGLKSPVKKSLKIIGNIPFVTDDYEKISRPLPKPNKKSNSQFSQTSDPNLLVSEPNTQKPESNIPENALKLFSKHQKSESNASQNVQKSSARSSSTRNLAISIPAPISKILISPAITARSGLRPSSFGLVFSSISSSKSKGLSIYPMNSLPVYQALYSNSPF